MDSLDPSKKDPTSQSSKQKEKNTPPRSGKLVLHRSRLLLLACAAIEARLCTVLTYLQILLLRSKNHLIKSTVKRSRAHPMLILPNPSHHHSDRRQASRIPPNPIISQVLTGTATSPSSQILSNSSLATRRRRPPGTNRCYPQWQLLRPRHHYSPELRPRVVITGRTH